MLFLSRCACDHASSFLFIHFMRVKQLHRFSLTVVIVVKVLGYVQNTNVEIFLGLCQKGSFEIYFVLFL